MRIFHVNFLVSAGVVGWIMTMVGCGGGTSDLPQANIPGETAPGTENGGFDGDPVQLPASQQDSTSPATSQAKSFPEVLIKTSMGDIHLRLDGEKSPRTVENFLYNYAERGFYDQTVVHYVESGYLIAAGGYTAELEPKEARTPITCEANNGLSNRKGTIAMARDPDFPDSATSQFFINLADNTKLDNQPGEDSGVNGYCVFGEVVKGMDVVERMAAVQVHDQGEFKNTPVEALVIEAVKWLR